MKILQVREQPWFKMLIPFYTKSQKINKFINAIINCFNKSEKKAINKMLRTLFFNLYYFSWNFNSSM